VIVDLRLSLRIRSHTRPNSESVGLGVPAGAPFILTAIGHGLTFVEPLLVSNRLAEPNYDPMRTWDPDSMPAGWQAARTRYFALNWIRAAATWSAFALFLAALLTELRAPV
jgi:hypothetical protein